MPARISLRVGKPTFAVIRLTWRLRPSRIVNSIHEVGMFFRVLIGGFLGGKSGA